MRQKLEIAVAVEVAGKEAGMPIRLFALHGLTNEVTVETGLIMVDSSAVSYSTLPKTPYYP